MHAGDSPSEYVTHKDIYANVTCVHWEVLKHEMPLYRARVHL